jgi:hypothetical protein
MAKKLGKQACTLIALGAAVVVLVGAFLLIKLLPGAGEAEATPTPAADIIIYECDRNDITGFSLANADAAWDIQVRKQDKTVTNSDGEQETQTETVYILTGYPDVPLNESNVGNVLTNFSRLVAKEVVETETPADLAPYGLDPPAVTAVVRLSGGTSQEIYLGNKTGAGNSYYMMKQGDPAVYTVALTYADRFSYTMDDLVKTNVVPALETTALDHILLKRAGQPDLEATHWTTPEGQARLGVAGFKIVKPYTIPKDINANTFDTFMTNIGAIGITGIVSLDDSQKAEYGLTEPRMELSAADASNAFTLYFGGDYGEEMVCCTVAGYAPIYAVDKQSIAFLETVTPEDLADKFLLLPMIDDVERVDITIGGGSHTMTIERRTEKATEEGAEDKVIETYFLDGVQKDEDAFKEVYQAAIGVTADVNTTDPALTEGATIATITYYFSIGDIPSMTVTYYTYDNDFYAGAVEGEPKALVAKRKVDAIATAMDTLIQSEYTGE